MGNIKKQKDVDNWLELYLEVRVKRKQKRNWIGLIVLLLRLFVTIVLKKFK